MPKTHDPVAITRHDDTFMVSHKDLYYLTDRDEFEAQVLVKITGETVSRTFCFIEDINGRAYLADTITGSLYRPESGQCCSGALLIVSELRPTGRVVPGPKARTKEAEKRFLEKQPTDKPFLY